MGYSFLSDPRNGWTARQQHWIGKRIQSQPTLAARWQAGRHGNGFPEQEVTPYANNFREFQESLHFLIHILWGQPARSTEALSIRVVNTANGGMRNVFVHQRMISFVVSYHKGMNNLKRGKIIHRYLPREVGELLVWYLLLVLPFWQDITGLIKGADRVNSFLWAGSVVDRAESAAGADESAGAQSAYSPRSMLMPL